MAETGPPLWKIGLLFSRGGPTGLSDQDHFFGAALAIEQLNRAGGVLGRPIDVVAYDPKSDPAAYRDCAERLLTEDGVTVVFGCHTSASRKAVLRSIERRNGLLWYPSIYEGFEYSPNVLCTGPVSNQTVLPLADYLAAEFGLRCVFVGSDYIFPRETNRVMRDLVEARGGEVLAEAYLPMVAPEAALAETVARIGRLAPDVVFSTLVGESGRRFYRLYRDAGHDPARRPIASLTMAEGELRAIGPDLCAGHITAASYFASLPGDANAAFRRALADRFGPDRPATMFSAASYAQVMLFAGALERAGALDAERLVDAALGSSFEGPEGVILIDEENNHAWLTPRIGRADARGEFEVVWSAPELVRPDPYLALVPPAPAGRTAAR